MKKMKKRIVTLAVALLLAVGLVPVTAFAELDARFRLEDDNPLWDNDKIIAEDCVPILPDSFEASLPYMSYSVSSVDYKKISSIVFDIDVYPLADSSDDVGGDTSFLINKADIEALIRDLNSIDISPSATIQFIPYYFKLSMLTSSSSDSPYIVNASVNTSSDISDNINLSLPFYDKYESSYRGPSSRRFFLIRLPYDMGDTTEPAVFRVNYEKYSTATETDYEWLNFYVNRSACYALAYTDSSCTGYDSLPYFSDPDTSGPNIGGSSGGSSDTPLSSGGGAGEVVGSMVGVVGLLMFIFAKLGMIVI